jgi:23S rRNA pseudouridine1911/1915/1917 synthase
MPILGNRPAEVQGARGPPQSTGGRGDRDRGAAGRRRSEPLMILFEDAHLVVVAKPAGLLTQGRPGGEPTLEAAVRGHLAPEAPGACYLGTVHRLDRPVSGVTLWAKTPKAARRLAEQFAGREARKQYWAVVAGTPAAGAGTWDDWLGAEDAGQAAVRVVRPADPRARRAITRYEVAPARLLPPGAAWLRLWPETGRTHQLRVQAAARGLPILGDVVYGSTAPFPRGIALHARRLTIRHPLRLHPMTFEAPVPASWTEAGIQVGS